jgi:hypothetical protein
MCVCVNSAAKQRASANGDSLHVEWAKNTAFKTKKKIEDDERNAKVCVFKSVCIVCLCQFAILVLLIRLLRPCTRCWPIRTKRIATNGKENMKLRCVINMILMDNCRFCDNDRWILYRVRNCHKYPLLVFYSSFSCFWSETMNEDELNLNKQLIQSTMKYAK